MSQVYIGTDANITQRVEISRDDQGQVTLVVFSQGKRDTVVSAMPAHKALSPEPWNTTFPGLKCFEVRLNEVSQGSQIFEMAATYRKPGSGGVSILAPEIGNVKRSSSCTFRERPMTDAELSAAVAAGEARTTVAEVALSYVHTEWISINEFQWHQKTIRDKINKRIKPKDLSGADKDKWLLTDVSFTDEDDEKIAVTRTYTYDENEWNPEIYGEA